MGNIAIILWVVVGVESVIFAVLVVPWKQIFLNRWGNDPSKAIIRTMAGEQTKEYNGGRVYLGKNADMYHYQIGKEDLIAVYPNKYTKYYLDGRLLIKVRLGSVLALPEGVSGGEGKVEDLPSYLDGISGVTLAMPEFDSDVIYQEVINKKGEKEIIPISDAPVDVVSSAWFEGSVHKATLMLKQENQSNLKPVLIIIGIVVLVAVIGFFLFRSCGASVSVVPSANVTAPSSQQIIPLEPK